MSDIQYSPKNRERENRKFQCRIWFSYILFSTLIVFDTLAILNAIIKLLVSEDSMGLSTDNSSKVEMTNHTSEEEVVICPLVYDFQADNKKPEFDDSEDSSGSSDWSREVQGSHHGDPGGCRHCHPSPLRPCCRPGLEEEADVLPSSLDNCLLHRTLPLSSRSAKRTPTAFPSPRSSTPSALPSWSTLPGSLFSAFAKNWKEISRRADQDQLEFRRLHKIWKFLYQLLNIQTPNCLLSCHQVAIWGSQIETLNCQKCQLLFVFNNLVRKYKIV